MRLKMIFNPTVTFVEVLYIGNKDLFKKHMKEINRQMYYKSKALFLVCPSRFLRGVAVPWAIQKKFKCLCAGGEKYDINFDEIDDLYSEKTIVDFYNQPKSVYISLDRLLGKKDPLAVD
jgi:hypothetical protein